MSELTVQVSDTLPLADVLQLSLALLDKQVHVYDALSLSDDFTLFVPEIVRLRLGDKLYEFADGVQYTNRYPLGRDSSDTLLFSDFSTVLLALLLAVHDTLTLVDTPHVAVDGGNAFSDSMSFDDSVSVNLSVELSLTFSDGLVLSDSVNILASNAMDLNLRNYLNDKS